MLHTWKKVAGKKGAYTGGSINEPHRPLHDLNSMPLHTIASEDGDSMNNNSLDSWMSSKDDYVMFDESSDEEKHPELQGTWEFDDEEEFIEFQEDSDSDLP
jgi:hypothetical protein